MVFLKHIDFNSYQKDKRDFDNKKSKMEAMEKRLVRRKKNIHFVPPLIFPDPVGGLLSQWHNME